MHERGHSRPRMWAQYAENHAGCCLVFDKQTLNEAFERLTAKLGMTVFSGNVVYENTRVAPNLSAGPFSANMNDVRRYGIEEAARRHGLRYWRELFLTKNTDWAAEREFRWLLHGRCQGDLLANVAGSLSGILLGPSIQEKQKHKVLLQAERLGIDAALLDWNNGIPEIRSTRFLRTSQQTTGPRGVARVVSSIWKMLGP